MEKIYLLHGKAQSGKDTCADKLESFYKSIGKRVIRIAFADYVKFVLDKYYSIPHERTPAYRSTIQAFATDKVRANIPTYWANTVSNLLYAIRDDFDIAIIPDWRFSNEYISVYCAMHEYSKIVRVNIKRDNLFSIDKMTEEQRKHQSESELDFYENFDYNIINHGSESFYHDVERMVMEIENAEK